MSASLPRVVGIIPARYGSTRLPGKALLPIGGKPMIQHVYERARAARRLDAVFVATDDARIARAVEACGGTALPTSSSHPSGTDRLAEAVEGIDADIVVNIQGDQPFIDPALIDQTLQPLLDDPHLPMATAMHAIVHDDDLADPGVVKVVTNCVGDALYFSRSLLPYPRQPIPHAVYEHIGLYAYRRDFLLTFARLAPTPLEQIESLEQLRALEHGYRIRVVASRLPAHDFTGFSVDTAADLARAEALWRERKGA